MKEAMTSIYVDMDDVLAHSTRSYVDVLHREFGKTVSYEDVTSFDLGVSFDLSRSELQYLFSVIHRPGEILRLERVPGARTTLRQWERDGFSIAIVTGRIEKAYEASLEWLKKNDIPYHQFFMVNKYGRESEPPRQQALSLEQFTEMKFSFAVEDSPDMAVHLVKKMDVPVALLDRPWNRKAEDHGKIRRHFSWDTIAGAARREG
jgi:uncharacterized HAD superfamily protein